MTELELKSLEMEVAINFPIDRAKFINAALQEREERSKGCEWCIGFCPDVTGDPYADYRCCPMCGRKLKGADNV